MGVTKPKQKDGAVLAPHDETGVLTPREEDGIVLTPEQQRSRRNRNIAIGLAVGLCAVLFYVVTIAKLGPGILNRPL